MDPHNILLNQVKSRVEDQSLVAELAAVLDISYDAAHRRISGKSRLTLDEAIRICNHYHLSADRLFMPGGRVLAEKTAEIRSSANLADYLKQSIGILASYKHIEGARLYYSAKDIPLFYTIDDSLLSRFKLFVWLSLLSGQDGSTSFEQFSHEGPALEYGKILRDTYKDFEVHEIWNDTTVQSIVQQIYYYYSAGLLNIESARQLLAELEVVLKQVEERSGQNDNRYHLYYNELLILNNNVLICSAQRQALFVPYNLLGYFITDDADTCAATELFFQQQIKHSTPLNNSSLRDRKMFFNRGLQKISSCRQRLEFDAGSV